jgi:hypothetical protein
MAWHDKEYPVRVDAIIDKRWRLWTASEYFEIVGLIPDDKEPPLFDRQTS